MILYWAIISPLILKKWAYSPYTSAKKNACKEIRVPLLKTVSVSESFLSADGRNWNYSFIVRYPPEFKPLLVLIVLSYLFIMTLFSAIIYARLNQERIVRDRIDLHIRGIAHDLSSPVGALKTIAKNQNLLSTEKGRQLFNDATARTLQVVDSIKERSGVTEKKPISIHDISKIISHLIQEKEINFNHESIRCIYHNNVPEDKSIIVAADPFILSRILSNILNNSVEALEKVKEKNIDIKTRFSESYALIEVSDNGKGVPNSEILSLGKSEIKSTKKSGTGIGLYLASKSLEAWGGQLIIENLKPAGAKVTIMLPLYK